MTRLMWVVLLTVILILQPAPVARATVFNIPTGDVAALIVAINAANANGESDTIILAGGTYTLTEANNDIDGPNGLPSIVSGITIEGNGATIERATAALEFRILHVSSGGDLTLKDVTIRNGATPDFIIDRHGGSIYNNGTLTLNNSTVSDNSTGDGLSTDGSGGSGGMGGGIYNHYLGTVTLDNTTVSGNTTGDGGFGSTFAGGSGGSGGGIMHCGRTLTLNNSTVSGNTTGDGGGTRGNFGGYGGGGGGIAICAGTVMLNSSTVRDNTTGDGGEGGLFVAGGGAGGGISNSYGSVTLVNTTVAGNTTGDGGGTPDLGKYGGDGGTGGGIYNFEGSVTLIHTTVNHNTTGTGGQGGFGGGDGGDGGGIYNLRETLTLTNSTVSSNTTGSDKGRPGGGIGGGIYNFTGTVMLTHNTITRNTSDAERFYPGGIYNSYGTINIGGTILADNDIIGRGADCVNNRSGSLISQGYNLIGNPHSCTFSGPGDITGLDPKLGPLQLNLPGSTGTHALLPASPAIDWIPFGVNQCGTTINVDQRGIARPQDGDADSDTLCDIGSFELRPGTITLVKDVDPDSPDTTWDIEVTGPTSFSDVLQGDSATGVTIVSTGNYTITETAGADTDLAGYTTTYNCTVEGDLGPSGQGTQIGIAIVEDENVVCTFTNTRRQADLSLTKKVDHGTVTLGDEVTFTITVSNAGPDAATNVKVTDVLPAGLTFVSADLSQGIYEPASGLWTVGIISASDRARLEITGRGTATGRQENAAEVVAVDQLDPDSTPGNNDPTEDDQAQIAVVMMPLVRPVGGYGEAMGGLVLLGPWIILLAAGATGCVWALMLKSHNA